MKQVRVYIFVLIIGWPVFLFARENRIDTLIVIPVSDFEIDGIGNNAQWQNTSWVNLIQIDSGVSGYDTRFKILYSPKGIYVLFSGKDKKITSSYQDDFDDLYKADVFEVFFHPNPAMPLYFEYEINANNKELVLLIPNLDGKLMGWRPWHYEGVRQVTKKIHVEKAKGKMESWTAECFFPFELLQPLQAVPPVKGTFWNANFCRLDYDSGKMIKWSWSPVKINFHEFHQFQALLFQ